MQSDNISVMDYIFKENINCNYVIKDWNRDTKQIFGSECKVTNTVYVISLKALT